MFRLGVAVAVACAVLAAPVARVSAQEPAVGARVRVRASGSPEHTLIGTLAPAVGDQLVLRIKGQTEPVVMARADLVKLEVSRGRRTGRGALVGAGVGAAAGALFAIAVCRPGVDCDPGGYGLIFGSTAAALGAGLGALAGLSERWREVPLRGARVAVAPVVGRRTGLSVAVRF